MNLSDTFSDRLHLRICLSIWCRPGSVSKPSQMAYTITASLSSNSKLNHRKLNPCTTSLILFLKWIIFYLLNRLKFWIFVLGLACAPIVETRFLELAMSLLDFSPRVPLGAFSILLVKLVYCDLDWVLVENVQEVTQKTTGFSVVIMTQVSITVNRIKLFSLLTFST